MPDDAAQGHVAVELAGVWSLSSEDGQHHVDYAVPGDVHSSLIAAGAIPHPYIGKNELDVRWVADQNWTARRSFVLDDVPNGFLYLDIDYLDTVAEVHLNGALVLVAQNCFQRYRPDVTQHVRQGENIIEIVFHSATRAANATQDSQPFYIPYSANNNPIPNGNMLRKPGCHFGWDWNLAIVPFGLYGRIALCHMDHFRVEHVCVQQKHGASGENVVLDIDVTLHGRGEGDVSVSFAGETKSRKVNAIFGDVKQRFRFTVTEPKLWWPAGHGEQPLYELVVSCESQTVTRQVGLRKVELVTDKDATGSRFGFKVNGREVFCRGANWIPADALPSQATPEITRNLLQSAIDANMNMVRVWGGGYYEKDFFYNLCDEMGLMVWQDFMFSCHLYPSTPAFLTEVKQEVSYQVKRLQHHACLTLWCGDNELLGALTSFKESKEDRDRYLVSYDRLNRTIEDAMHAADPLGLWWPSSPSPGLLDFGDTWHDDTKGDMHFWSVWHEGRDFEHYRDVKPRFCSEFGFQSYPSLVTMAEFAAAEDYNISSSVMEHHQRNAGGNARIAETMFRYFRFPLDFGNFVYISQIQQGLAMRTAVDYWRSLKPHCLGSLIWKLNDTWTVASWSGLTHGGDWKALHYMARDFYAPVSVSVVPEKDTGDLVVTGVNDTAEDVAIELALFAVSTRGERTDLMTLSSTIVPERATELGRIGRGHVADDQVLFWSFGKQRRHAAMVPYKHLPLVAPGLKSKVKVVGDTLKIDVSARNLALQVMLETSVHGRFSDNVFDLLPGEKRVVTFAPTDPADAALAAETLVLRDLYSSSHSGKD